MNLDLDKSTWKRVAFGDVATASKEKWNQASDPVERYIAGEHMDTDDLKIHRWGEVGDGYLGPAFHRRFRSGQVLYGSRRTYLRKVAVAEFDGVCANTTFVVEPKDEATLLRDFLPFVMTSAPFHAFAIAESKGSVNPYVNWSDLARYEFDLPSLDEQQRVADLLWSIEHEWQASKRLLESLAGAEALQFSTILESGGWPSVRVAYLVLAGPSNGKSAVANDQDRGIPTLSISAIRAGAVVGGDAVKFVDVAPADVAQFVLADGDFLVVRGNGNKQLVARGGLMRGGLPAGCIYPDLLIRLRFDPAKMLPEFAAAQWNSPAAHRALLSKAKSTNGIWKINGKDIKSHSLLVPPLPEQERMLRVLDAYRSARSAIDADIDANERLHFTIAREIFGGGE